MLSWAHHRPFVTPYTHSHASDYVLKVAGRNSYIHGPYELIQFSQIVRMLTKGNDVELGMVRIRDPTDDLPRDIPDVRRERERKREREREREREGGGKERQEGKEWVRGKDKMEQGNKTPRKESLLLFLSPPLFFCSGI